MNLHLKDFDKKSFAKGGISQGGRHNAAVAYANDLLFNLRVPYETLNYEMQRWNKTNKPPLLENELTRIINDAFNYFQKQSGGQHNAWE